MCPIRFRQRRLSCEDQSSSHAGSLCYSAAIRMAKGFGLRVVTTVRNVRVIGSTLRSRRPKVRAQILADLVKNVWLKVEAGEVKPTVHKVLPITEAEAAQDVLCTGQDIGKVVLTI